MTFEQKDNSGALFKNSKKEKPSHPDYTGSAKVDDEEFWVSGWLNKPKAGGDTYLSLQFKPKEESASRGSFDEFESTDSAMEKSARAKVTASKPSFDDDEIPF